MSNPNDKPSHFAVLEVLPDDHPKRKEGATHAVVNVIVANQHFVDNHLPKHQKAIHIGRRPGAGWHYVHETGAFIPPHDEDIGGNVRVTMNADGNETQVPLPLAE